MANTYAIPVQAYTSTAKTLHWLTAALVLTIIPVGVAMTYLQGPLQDFFFHIHRSLGVTLIPLIIYRLFYRLTHKPLPLPDDIEPMQKLAAEAVHWLLYGLLIVQPILGWIATSAIARRCCSSGPSSCRRSGRRTARCPSNFSSFTGGSGSRSRVFCCAHIGGALFHYFIRKDRVLHRMING